MDNVCLLVIDERIIQPLIDACQDNDLSLLRMGDPGIEVNYENVINRGGHVPPGANPVEFILNEVNFTQFMDTWNTTGIPNRTVHWVDGGPNRYDGISHTLILYLAEIAAPRQRTELDDAFDTVPPTLRPARPGRIYGTNPGPAYVDEDYGETRYDEEGDEDLFGQYDDDGEYHEEWEETRPTSTSASTVFNVICEENAIADDDYNQNLATLRERTMTLTADNIRIASPSQGIYWEHDSLKAFMAEHFNALNRSVTIKAPAGSPYFEMTPTPGMFHIICFSTPILGAGRTITGNNISQFLDPVTQRRAGQAGTEVSSISMFAPADMPFYNERYDIVDPTTGVVMAQLFNQKYLYILFHCTATYSQREKDVLKYIITAALASMSSLPSAIRNQYQINLMETKTRLEEAANEKLKIALNRLFTAQFRNRQESLLNSINRLDELIEAHLREISGNYKRIAVARSELGAINASIAKADAGINVEEFFNHPKIDKIVPDSQHVNLITKHLFFTIPDNQLVFDLGVISINIELEGAALPYLFNKTRTIRGLEPDMHHPHVFPRGNPCWGNVSNTLQKLFNSGEIRSYIDVIIAYLESVNLRDAAGEKAYRWPLAAEKHQTIENYRDVYKDATSHLDRTGDVL